MYAQTHEYWTYIHISFWLKIIDSSESRDTSIFKKKNKNKRKQNLRQKSFIWRLVHQRETFLWSSTSKKEHSTALAYNEIALEWCAFISIMDIFISLFILFCFFFHTLEAWTKWRRFYYIYNSLTYVVFRCYLLFFLSINYLFFQASNRTHKQQQSLRSHEPK